MRCRPCIVLLVALALTGFADAATRRQGDSPGGTLAQPAVPDFRGAGDGPVYEAVDPSGTLWATWTYRRGLELDIAISQQVGRTWTAPEIIGLPGVDDLDPRIVFAAGGAPVVVWWERETGTQPSRVLYATRVNNAWTAPAVVDTAAVGSIPTVLVVGDNIVVMFADPDGVIHTNSIRIRKRSGGDGVDSGTNGPDPMPSSY